MNALETTNTSKILNKNIFEKKEDKNKLELNNIVEAVLAKRENGIAHLTTKDNLELKAPEKSIVGEIGDTLKFEVTYAKDSVISLKQITNTIKQDNAKINTKETESIKDMFKQCNFIEDDKKQNDQISKEDLEKNAAVTNIKRKLSYGKNTLNKNAINQLISQGISLDKIDLSMLTKTIKETKTSTKNDDKLQNNKDKVIDSLQQNNMPQTKQNIASLNNLISKTESITKLDQPIIKDLIKNNTDLTIDNIYKAKFSANNQPSEKDEQIFNDLQPEIETLLSSYDLKIDNDNLTSSKFLFNNDLDISKENINKVQFLNNLKFDVNSILDNGIKNIQNNINVSDINIYNKTSLPPDANIIKSLTLEYTKIMKILPSISIANLNSVVEAGLPLTLNTIVNSSKSNNSQANDFELESMRQLYEIQLKLTVEASNRLANKNININTMLIKDALQTLKEQEKQSIVSKLNILNVDTTTSSINKMSSVIDKVSSFKNLTNNVFGNIILNKENFDIDGIHNSLLSAKLSKNYEVFETVVNPKYGDSFKKVEPMLKEFLENIGVPVIEQNIKAASILSKNKIDITEENLLKIKNIDSKISSVHNRLHPIVVSSMLKEGLNPEKMHIDEVLDYIDKFDGIFGDNLGDKISSHILELDESKDYTAKERDAMIAVYRMLNNIQKNNSVSLGLLIKNDANLTLGNMLEASKISKNRNLDYKIDEEFGMLEEIKNIDSNIKPILQEYNESLTYEFTKNSTPFALNKVLIDDAAYTKPFENLNTELKNTVEENLDEILNKQLNLSMQKAQNMLKTPPEYFLTLTDSNIMASHQNIIAYDELKNNPSNISKTLESLQSEEIIDCLDSTDLNSLKNGKTTGSILSNISDKLNNLEITSKNIQKIPMLQSIFSIQDKLSKSKNQEFNLPIKFNGSVSNLNVYVVNEHLNSDSPEIFMALNTKNLGLVNITIKKDSLLIKGSDDTATKFLMDNKNILNTLIENSNLDARNINFDFKEINSLQQPKKKPIEIIPINSNVEFNA